MRIVCQQTILMKYHALFITFEEIIQFYAKYRGYTPTFVNIAAISCLS